MQERADTDYLFEKNVNCDIKQFLNNPVKYEASKFRRTGSILHVLFLLYKLLLLNSFSSPLVVKKMITRSCL